MHTGEYSLATMTGYAATRSPLAPKSCWDSTALQHMLPEGMLVLPSACCSELGVLVGCLAALGTKPGFPHPSPYSAVLPGAPLCADLPAVPGCMAEELDRA